MGKNKKINDIARGGMSLRVKKLILTYQNLVKYAESYGEYTLKKKKKDIFREGNSILIKFKIEQIN